MRRSLSCLLAASFACATADQVVVSDGAATFPMLESPEPKRVAAAIELVRADPTSFGLCDDCEPVLTHASSDDKGRLHLRLAQTSAGVLLSTIANAHFDAKGAPYRPANVTPRQLPSPGKIEPKLSVDEVVRRIYGDKPPPLERALIYAPRFANGIDGWHVDSFRLAYRLTELHLHGVIIVVDAITGELLSKGT